MIPRNSINGLALVLLALTIVPAAPAHAHGWSSTTDDLCSDCAANYESEGAGVAIRSAYVPGSGYPDAPDTEAPQQKTDQSKDKFASAVK